jgi:hypothetical protein
VKHRVSWLCVVEFPGLSLRDCNFRMLCHLTLYVFVLLAQLSFSIALTKFNVYFMLHFEVVYSVHYRTIYVFITNN